MLSDLPIIAKVNIESKIFDATILELYNPRLTHKDRVELVSWYKKNFSLKQDIIDRALESVVDVKMNFIDKQGSIELIQEYTSIKYQNRRMKYLNIYLIHVNAEENRINKPIWKFSTQEIVELFYTTTCDKKAIMYDIIYGFLEWLIKEQGFKIKNKLKNLDRSKLSTNYKK